MFECLVIGDTHFEKLDHFLPVRKGGWVKVQLRILQQAVDYCRARGISHIIHLGDVFETPYPEQRSISLLIQFMSRCTDITWDWILGNHDYHDRLLNSLEVTRLVSKLGVLKHVKIHTKLKTVKRDGVPITFLPWPETRPPRIVGGQVVVAHCDISGARYDNGLVVNEGVRPRNNDDLWLVGHIHKEQIMGRVHFVGTPYQLGFLETQARHFGHYTFSMESGRLEHTRVVVPVRLPYLLHNLTVTNFDGLALEGGHNYYRLVLGEGVHFPRFFLEENPQVIRHSSVKAAANGKVQEAAAIASYQERRALKARIRGSQLTKWQARTALKIRDRIERNLAQ